MTKSQPFSIRLSPENDALITDEARRTRRSKSAVVEALAGEALRMRRYPGIAFRGTDWERRAWVVGTALDVWEIVMTFRDFGSVERMTSDTDLSEGQVQLALAYSAQFPAEVAETIEQSRASIEELRVRFPAIDVLEGE